VSIDLGLLIGLTATGAGWLVSHLSLLMRAVTSGQAHAAVRLLSLFPPATPLVAWYLGHRMAAIVWALFGIVYLGLWMAVS
jgi:hypothetical protein